MIETELLYDLEFLKEKGFVFDSHSISVNNQSYSCQIDTQNNLIYFDRISDNNIIAEILKTLKRERNFEYFWFYFSDDNSHKIIVHRRIGENKWFTYNPSSGGLSEYKKSKEDKLRNFSPQRKEILFDIKDLIDTFYQDLWKIRIGLAKSILHKISDGDKIIEAQRIIDRIIFIYFIGQKGIIKLYDGEGNKLKLDIKGLFKWFLGNYKKNVDFYNFLFDFFFNYLNTREKNRYPFVFERKKYFLEVPFLNGGLFTPGKFKKEDSDLEVSEKDIFIKDFNWGGLLEELNKYHWIIGDYIPTEEGEGLGNLTPEILGHLYEKFVIGIENKLEKIKLNELKITKAGDLKIGNKEIGAYYTPEEITDYISKNTLLPFLKDKIKFEAQLNNFDDLISENKDKNYLDKLNKTLREIKILDPACGSGAFLMASADLLFDWIKKTGDIRDEYDIRKEIIINNLYGVDIMDGAIEVAKLRLWLWMISSSSHKIEPLPNLDFNLMRGNSLVGYINIEKFLKPNYISDHIKFKNHEDLIKYDSLKGLLEYILPKKMQYKLSHGTSRDMIKKEIDRISHSVRTLLSISFINEMGSKGLRVSVEDFRKLKPFHWGFEFYEIFDLKKKEIDRGFDVIIGNPPYGAELTNLEKKYLDKKNERFCSRTKNSAIYFIFLSDNLLKNNHPTSFIIPKSICYSYGWNSCANFLVNGLIKLIDVGKAFEKVKLEQVIFLRKKGFESPSYVGGLFNGVSIEENSIINKKTFFEHKVLLAGQTNDEINLINNILKKFQNRYSEYVEINRGVNWQSVSKKSKGETPIYRGEQLSPYYLYKAIDFINLRKFSQDEYQYLMRPKILNQLAIAHVKRPYPHFYLQSCLDSNGNKLIFETISATFAKNPKVDLKFLLSLNNSKLFAWLLYKFVYSNAIRSTRFDEQYVGKLVVPDFIRLDQKPFINFVDKILDITKSPDYLENKEKQEKVKELQKEIDKLVYEIYKLTPEEIKIIEPS